MKLLPHPNQKSAWPLCRQTAPLLLVLLVILLPGMGIAAGQESTPATQQDEALIRQCLDLARSAVAKGNEPFGALLVRDGQVVMRAENTINTDDNVTHHAETKLLADVYRKYGSKGFEGATLYSSCEPCAMCCGAIYLMGVSRVVYGLSTARLSAMSGFPEDITSSKFFAVGKRKVELVGPVLEDEAAEVMAEYLKKVRK